MSKNPLCWVYGEAVFAKRRIPEINKRIALYHRLSVAGNSINEPRFSQYERTAMIWEPLKPHKKGFFSRTIKYLRKHCN